MIKLIKIGLITIVLLMDVTEAYAQSFNAGFVFQYHIFKQVDIHANSITGTYSHDQFNIKENNWKAFAAGQSIVVGMMAQMDYKKFYFTTEFSYNLNTYRYALFYPVAPSKEEKIMFKTLYQQMEIPFYVGYQFQSTNLVRYSFFTGAILSVPLLIDTYFDETKDGSNYYDRYDVNDLRYILYNDKPYTSGVIGLGIHIASLAKVDIRYIYRFTSPGKQYEVDFNTVGIAFTYYLPLNLKKKKFYYEE